MITIKKGLDPLKQALPLHFTGIQISSYSVPVQVMHRYIGTILKYEHVLKRSCLVVGSENERRGRSSFFTIGAVIFLANSL